jgi:hypothetical protein
MDYILMNKHIIPVTIGIIAILGTLGITSPIGQSASADAGGDPNNSDQALENAIERHDKKLNSALEKFVDDNPNNDNGPIQAHDNTHDGKGLDP